MDLLNKKGTIMDIQEVARSIEKDNPTGAQAITDYVTAANATIAKVGDLEKSLKGSAEKRDSLKTIIRQATGLEDITTEGLTDFLTKDNEQVQTYQKEISGLQGKLSESANAVDEVSRGYEEKIFTLNLDRIVTMMGAADEVHNAHAYGVVFGALKDNATTDDQGDIVYKNPDGTTIYAENGNPASVQSMYESLRGDDNYSYLFKEQYLTGGGKGPQGPKTSNGGETLRRSQMDDGAKATYIAKHSMNAYRQLPL